MNSVLLTIVLSLIYLGLSITNPISSSSSSLNLSDFQIRLIQLTISIPFIASWISGVTGYQDLSRYAWRLKDKYLKQSFKNIALGILILVLSSLVTAFIGVIRNRLTGPGLQFIPLLTILTNYIYVFVPLLALLVIMLSAKSLSRSIKAPPITKAETYFTMLFPLGISILNGYLTITNPNRQGMSDPSIQASYYLPDFFIVTTILIPSIITWFIGTGALLHIQNYARYVKGTVFQSAISLFSTGLLLIISSSAFLQFLLSLGSSRLMSLGTNLLLIVIYIFVILQTVGYILIARASRKFYQVDKILSEYSDQNNHESKE